MNTITGRAEEACADAGSPACREHAASGKTNSKATSLYKRDLRERIVPPSGKNYTQPATENRPAEWPRCRLRSQPPLSLRALAFFCDLSSIQYPLSADPATARPASCLGKDKKEK